MSKSPWKNRDELVKSISSFTRRHGGMFKQNAKRMSDLFEITVYNDVVRYYKRKKYKITVDNAGRNGQFLYRLSTSGLAENFSFFRGVKELKDGTSANIDIHHNIKLQSAHHEHMYFTADVAVCVDGGLITERINGGRRHSYVVNRDIITFFEAKHMNPFPEVLFGFSGVVLEIMPKLMSRLIHVRPGLDHICPTIAFSGNPSEHVRLVAQELSLRYGYNIVTGLFKRKGQVYYSNKLKELKDGRYVPAQVAVEKIRRIRIARHD